MVMKREEQKKENCWAIEDLYPTNEAWQKDYEKLEKSIPELSTYAGKISENMEMLLKFLDLDSELSLLGERIYVYANQRLHENTGNALYQEMSGKAMTLLVKKDAATAFFRPELLQIPEEAIKNEMEKNEKLAFYRRYLLEFYRKKDHILSDEIEEVLANAGEMSDSPSDIFSMFNNADIRFEPVIDENGNKREVTHGTYISLLEDKSKLVRKSAFENLYAQYKKYKNTLAAMYRANVKQHVFFAKTRKYNSSLEYGLSGAHIPEEVYHQLIDTVNEYLPLMHRYVELRTKYLGEEQIHMYDLYVPMVEGVDMKIPFEEAKKIVYDGLAPLGDDYRNVLKEGFENRWIDIYENEGKRSGAYSWGAYGTHPYVLMNYQDNLNNVFTLAHEMGHALHSYFSDESQPYIYAGYRIFVAEVASTCNESLLIHDLLEHAKNREEKAYLVNYFLDQFKGTLFRQTMFAEFEKITHTMVEKGETLTPENICEIYYNLNKKYYGDKMCVDEEIAMEWARIPHFYTPFYVYQYATGFSAAIAISRKILAGDKEVLSGYKKFLHSGGSMDPIDLLKLAGVDMTKKEPIVEAMGLFEQLLSEMEALYEG